MSFFQTKAHKLTGPSLGGVSVDFLHRHGCAVCPLNGQAGLHHPNMDAYGTRRPLIYILGEAPGETEDRRGRPFVGKAGQVLPLRIPEDFIDKIRWNNCVRCRPPDNRTPAIVEIECCRPSVVQDIEATKPKAIFGFGPTVLDWALKETGITLWAGRHIPVKIGNFKCWYFPFVHPQNVLDSRRFTPHSSDEYGSDEEFAFAVHLRNAFDIVEKLPEPSIHTKETARANIETITGAGGNRDLARVLDAFKTARGSRLVGFDYETNRLRPYSKGAKILSFAISHDEGTFAVALHHRQAKWTSDQIEKIKYYLRRFLYHVKCRKAAHNVAFELEWSAYTFGREVVHSTEWGCTQAQAFILDERLGSLSLESLCMQHFGINTKELHGLNRKKLDEEPIEDVLQYNGVDAKYHRWLYKRQDADLHAADSIEQYKHHLSRIPAMVLTQIKGIPVDFDRTRELMKEYKKRRTKIEDKLFALKEVTEYRRRRGHEFSPSSPHHMKYLVQKILHIPVESVNEKALEGIKHPIVKLVLDWRKVQKNISTYITPLMPDSEKIFPDKLAHPITNTMSTRTWRTSAEDFNYQNFPKHEAKDKVIRTQLRAKPGQKIVAFDYAGIQARNVAMESLDHNLVDAFWNDYDIHRDWMKRIAREYPRWIKEGVSALKDPTVAKAYRQRAKNEFVFASFFGAQPPKLAMALGIPEYCTVALHEEFWDKFPDIDGWHKKLRKFYYENGYITGLSGFRRHAPVGINELINTPIQSDESIIVCGAMARLSKMGDERLQPNMEIHDDLTFFMEKRDIDKLSEIIAREMTRPVYEWMKAVPIVVEMSIGDDWGNLKEVAKFSSQQMWDHKRKT